MAIGNNSIINGTYDLSLLLSKNALSQPTEFIAVLNMLLQGVLIPAVLIIFGLLIYFLSKQRDNNDLTAIMHASFITSFMCLMLFLVQVSGVSGVYKLVTWPTVIPFLVIFAGALFMDKVVKNY